jgi:hypothetical protein
MQSVTWMDRGGLEDPEGNNRWIVRRLLTFDKVRRSLLSPPFRRAHSLHLEQAQLVEHCTQNSLPYFIDPINLDPEHTPRNALCQTLAEAQARHLSYPHALPSASSANSGLLHLLHRILTTPWPSIQPSHPPNDLLTLNSPFAMTLILRPQHLPSRTRPSETRALLRRIVAFASPLHQDGSISEAALEGARRRIRESPKEGKRAFTPGAGVVFAPRRRTGSKIEPAHRNWVVGRQPRRREGRHAVSAHYPFELPEGEGRVWDGRVWFRVEKMIEGDEGWRWWVEEKGQWSLPVVMRSSRGAEGKSEVVLDFSQHGEGVVQIHAEGSIEVGDSKITWACRKDLR